MKTSNNIQALVPAFVLLLMICLGCSKQNYPTSGAPVDGDGNYYKTIVIGDQEWLAGNLKTTKYNNGKSIKQSPIKDGFASYYWYNNDTANKEKYGALYSWRAVKKKKLCPCGWKVPEKKDWIQLEDAVREGYGNVAKALASQNGWLNSNKPGAVGNMPHKNNSSGFNAVPAGSYRAKDEKYRLERVATFFWSTSEHKDWYTFAPMIASERDSVGHPNLVQTGAHSVRCIKKKEK
ncbi:hypothetical protein E9993_08210 [Labilibacter sediminis]|nr:hypothetical protein E9993_08210 [Labilibacter sediminis]